MKRLVVASLLIMSAFLQNFQLAAAETSVTLYPVADNYADSKYPNSAYGSHTTFLYVGNSYDHAQNIWGSERIYIRFDLSGLPKHYVVAQAALKLWQYYAPKSNQTYEAHRVLGDWNETTQNWNNQPSWASVKTSETIAPPLDDVAVEWDITSDVKAWYAGEARNYGTMIKVAKEEHVQDASSGFWSREYPVDSHEEWKPKLVVVFRGEAASAYVVTLTATGLANGIASTIIIDGQVRGSVYAGRDEKITFDRGTAHAIAVSEVVTGAPGVRYRCDLNRIEISAATSHVFIYVAEYYVAFSTEPSSMFQTPATGWYADGTELPVNRTGADLINTLPETRLAFDAWYLNGKRLADEPTIIIVKGPITLEGRYKTEYYLNVTSPIGTTAGSGWYAKDSVAFFSVDRSTVPAEGLLGLLGLKRSFMKWVGSSNFLGLPVEPQGSVTMKAPATVDAVWGDDWSSLLVNIAIALLAIVVVGVVAIGAFCRLRSRRARRAFIQTRGSSKSGRSRG